MQHAPQLVKLFTEAMSCQAAGNPGGALLAYKKLQRQFPDFADAWTNASVLLCGMGRLEEAMHMAERAVELAPGDAAAQYSAANASMCLGRFEEAESALRRVIECDPSHALALTNLAGLCERRGDAGEAMGLHDRAVGAAPSNSLILARRGHSRVKALDMEGAEADLRRTLELDAGNEQASQDLAHVWLRTHRYRDAWRHFKARQGFTEMAVNACGYGRPFWKGGDLGGCTLLVYSERGFGDTIQFARLLPLVRERHGGRMLLSVHEPVLRLLSDLPGVDSLLLQGGPLPPYDFVAPITELPVLLEIDPAELPPPIQIAAPGYSLPELETPGFRVGLAWAGSPLHPSDAERSMDPRLLDGLADVPGSGRTESGGQIAWFGLQKPPAEDPPRLPGFTDMSHRMGDFMDTAQVAGQMDLIVTVDTSMAHLAGSLGLPTVVMLPHFPEWRWGLGETTPWYPTVKLIRQPSPGDWPGAVEALRLEIGREMERWKRNI